MDSSPDCRILPAPAVPVGSVTFALLEPVDLERAPWASNTSERIVFDHLYETLFTIDCEDGVRPGLAVSWTRDKGGRCWTFDLRGNARFWDGTPVTARDVVESWRDALTLDTVIDSASVVTDRTLRVYLGQPSARVPSALTASVYAVTKPSGDSRWLMGSGPYRIGSVDITAYPASRRTITVYPAFGHTGPVIRFVETTVDEARDGLGHTIDGMVTADPMVIDYAAGRPRCSTVALPWERTYVLLSSARVDELATGRTFAAIPLDVLNTLARDAVRGDARGFERPSWWDEGSLCGESPAHPSNLALDRSRTSAFGSSSGTRRIVYATDDPVARGLAERIVALAAADTARSREAKAVASAIPGFASGSSPTIAVGLTRDEFERSVRRGDESAYILSIPRQPPDPCFQARQIVERVPWLAGTGWSFADGLVPLVDARSHLIIEKDTVELTVDGYGSIMITPAQQEKR
jgi:hypothetical protein